MWVLEALAMVSAVASIFIVVWILHDGSEESDVG